MNPRLAKVLEDKRIDLWWADEVWGDRAVRRGWVGVQDVFCNLTMGAVAVPRRRRGGNHFAEVLHEVAHLELWRRTGKSPTKHNDAEVCRLALAIAREYGFGASTFDRLYMDLGDELAKRGAP